MISKASQTSEQQSKSPHEPDWPTGANLRLLPERRVVEENEAAAATTTSAIDNENMAQASDEKATASSELTRPSARWTRAVESASYYEPDQTSAEMNNDYLISLLNLKGLPAAPGELDDSESDQLEDVEEAETSELLQLRETNQLSGHPTSDKTATNSRFVQLQSRAAVDSPRNASSTVGQSQNQNQNQSNNENKTLTTGDTVVTFQTINKVNERGQGQAARPNSNGAHEWPHTRGDSPAGGQSETPAYYLNNEPTLTKPQPYCVGHRELGGFYAWACTGNSMTGIPSHLSPKPLSL